MKVKAALGVNPPPPPDPAVRLAELTAIMNQVEALLDAFASSVTVTQAKAPSMLDVTAFGDVSTTYLVSRPTDRYAQLQAEIAALERRVAAKKANDLLDRHLTKAQRTTLNRSGWLDVQGKVLTYRIHSDRARVSAPYVAVIKGAKPFETAYYNFNGEATIPFCVYIKDRHLPVPDQILAFKLAIEGAEETFLQTANPFSDERMKLHPDGSWTLPPEESGRTTGPLADLYAGIYRRAQEPGANPPVRVAARARQAARTRQAVHQWTFQTLDTTITTNTTNTNNTNNPFDGWNEPATNEPG